MTFSTMGCDMNPQPIVRIIRAVLGLVLIALAFFMISTTVGTVVGTIGIVVRLVGLVLIAAEIFNFCVARAASALRPLQAGRF